MKTVVSISSKINFKVKYITKDEEGHFTMIKRSVHQGGKRKLRVYTLWQSYKIHKGKIYKTEAKSKL